MSANNSIVGMLNKFLNKKDGENMCNTSINFSKFLKKFFIIAFSMIAFTLLSTGYIAHAETSGKCGDNLTWTLDDAGKLTISGTGDMAEYNESTMWNKSAVTSVDIQSGVTSIGKNAFEYCSSLTSVNIPESVTSIGYWAFDLCKSLPSIQIPAKVTRIGLGAFKGCSSLPSVDIPEGVTEIDVCMFEGCSSLTSVNIPESVTSIGWWAFQDSGLTSLVVPLSVESIGGGAFKDCADLKTLMLPSKFHGQRFDAPESTHITYYDGKCGDNLTWTLDDAGKLTISGEGDMYNYDVKTFWDHSAVNTVDIQEGVMSIGACAFCCCKNVHEIKIPDSVISISETAFAGCENVTSLEVPKNVANIGKGAFCHSGLMSITIPDNVESVGECAFEGCSNLKLAFLPAKMYGTATKEYLAAPDGACVCYVDSTGATSTKVDKEGMIWLKEESDGTSAWYGLANNGQFPIGSKFWVRWLSPTKDPVAWAECYNKLDEDKKALVRKDEDLWIFQIGVTDPAGNEIKNFNPTDLYIQMGDDWSMKDISAVYLSGGPDEALDFDYEKGYTLPDGTVSDVAKVTLNHFSDYALFKTSNKDQGSGETDNSSNEISDSTGTSDIGDTSTNSSYYSRTADTIMPQILYALAALMMLALAGLWVSLKKKQRA